MRLFRIHLSHWKTPRRRLIDTRTPLSTPLFIHSPGPGGPMTPTRTSSCPSVVNLSSFSVSPSIGDNPSRGYSLPLSKNPQVLGYSRRPDTSFQISCRLLEVRDRTWPLPNLRIPRGALYSLLSSSFSSAQQSFSTFTILVRRQHRVPFS